MSKKFTLISSASILFIGILAIQFFSFTAGDEHDKSAIIDESYKDHVTENYKVFSLPTPSEVDFCGEAVPLDRFGVREKLDRELLVNTYWHSNTFLAFKRANRWFPAIEKILKEEGVPEDFKYLALVESGLTDAVSPAGARGFWQFMPKTAESYGLEINDEVDERYHLEKATRAACAYLKESYKNFKDWALVAASYNMGVGGMNKQLNRQQVEEYWDLLLNEETGRYVYRILALKEILNNSEEYGFVVRPKDLYAPHNTRSIEVDSAVGDWAVWAKENDANYNVLKSLNPWLRDRSLSNKAGKSYEVLLPVKGE